MKDNQELKPCPKCNKSWIYVSDGDYYSTKGYRINCSCGYAWKTISWQKTKQETIEVWNRRLNNEKEKQIEEMVKEIECAKQGIWSGETPRNEDEDYLWHSRRIAEYLTQLGYRKIDKDSVVVLKEDWKDNHDLALMSGKKEGSKETAEKILAIIGNMIDECDDRFKLKDYQWHKDLCRQYNVEIKE